MPDSPPVVAMQLRRFRNRLLLLGVAVLVTLSVVACTRGTGKPHVEVAGDPSLGKSALVNYGCISCHSVPGVAGADTLVGPPLTAWSDRTYIAGMLPNTPDNLVAWIMNPQAVVPGNAMPYLGVTKTDAENIAAYLYTLDRGDK